MTPPTKTQLRLAAEARLTGKAWAEAAHDAGVPAAEAESWPRLFRHRWRDALIWAERRVAVSSGVEAMVALRRLLRSDDDKMKHLAAKELADIRFKLLKLDEAAPKAKDERNPLERLDDAELDRLLAGQPATPEGEA